MQTKTNFTLTRLTRFLNKVAIKKTGNEFNTSDVQGYIRRGKLPNYLGGDLITISEEIEGIKLYNISKING